MTRCVRALLSVVAALGLVAAADAPGSAVAARSGAAPVTAPDAVETYPGNLASLRPLRNDSDAEGDKLTICALGPEKYRGIDTDIDAAKDYFLDVRHKAAVGTYTFTYYACDGTSMTPGTVTLTVLKPPRITVRKLAGRPGHLRVTNGASFRIRFLYGDYTKDDAEGDLKIAKKTSVVISTRYTRIDWFALTADGGFSLRSGHVHGIRHPRAS
ncbi:MAG: hypothetical protein QOD98_754 [Nocardioidaceae bacterium]|jgi:hypothetical protein|nr:hypothetical protein [Nocardioidaceae bacterium]